MIGLSQSIGAHDTWFANPANAKDENLTRNWTQGVMGGCWYRTPISEWGKYITASVQVYLSGLLSRWYGRFAEADLLVAAMDPLAINSLGMNPYDSEHFCVRLIADAALAFPHEQSGLECGKLALETIESYYINVGPKPPGQGAYFRLDYFDEPYALGISGQDRKAGWAFAALDDALRLLNVFPNAPAKDLALAHVAKWVKYVHDNWPLIDKPDGPDGDHVNAFHIPVFQLGILARGMLGLNSTLKIVTGHRIAELDQMAREACGWISDHAFSGDGFWYDLPFDLATKQPVTDPSAVPKMKHQTAVGQTSEWVASPLTLIAALDGVPVSSALLWQRAAATHAGWTQKTDPIEMVKFFEGWLPTS